MNLSEKDAPYIPEDEEMVPESEVKELQLKNSGIKLMIPPGYEQIKIRKLNPDPAVREILANSGVVIRKIVPTSADSAVIYKTSAEKAMRFDDEEGVIRGIHECLAENQGLIEVNAGKTRRGYDYIYSIVKTLLSDFGGVQYYLRMNIGNQEDILEINAQFTEQGTTGMREAVAMSMATVAGLVSHEEKGFRGWSEDPYDPAYTKGILMNISERSGLDGLFPDNPLSQAREMLLAILNDEYVIVRKNPDSKSEELDETAEKTPEEKSEENKEFLRNLFAKEPVVKRRSYVVPAVEMRLPNLG